MTLRIGEAFSGYGGLGLGVQAALGGSVAWHCEIDPGACRVLEHRYPDVPNHGDVTAIDYSTVEPVDVYTAGFPCQDVSGAGRHAGLIHGTRSGLFHEVARAIRELRPPLVVLENVRGLLSARGDTSVAFERADAAVAAYAHLTTWLDARIDRADREGRTADARTLRARQAHRVLVAHRRAVADRRRAERRIVRAVGTVLGTLADLGYDTAWHGLRAADVGAPHGRWRIFIVAWPADGATGHPEMRGWHGAQLEGGGGEPAGQARGSNLLPTPRAGTKGGPGQRGSSGDLMLPSAVAMLPTPKARDFKGYGPADAERHDPNLSAIPLLLPTPSVADVMGGRKARSGDRSDEPLLNGIAADNRWGDYAPAIARWEALSGRPAPEPTTTSTKGNPQLSHHFVEWLMGLPAGWITDVPGITRNEALKALGNGVVPQQCAAALARLLPLIPSTP